MSMTNMYGFVIEEAPKVAHVKESNFIVSPFSPHIMPM